MSKKTSRVLPPASLRFVTRAQGTELVNLFHLARTALCGKGKGIPSRHEKMLWASGEFHKEHPEISSTAAFKDLEALLS